MKKVDNEHTVLTTIKCKQLLWKIIFKMWEKCLRHLASLLQQFHAIYRTFESWKKLDKWVLRELNEHHKLRRFEVWSISFLTELSLVTKNGYFMIIVNNTFQSKSYIGQRLWWQFGGLQLVLSTTAFTPLLQKFTAISLQTCMLPCKKRGLPWWIGVVPFC